MSSSETTAREMALRSMGLHYTLAVAAVLVFWVVGYILAPVGLAGAVAATFFVMIKVTKEVRWREAIFERRIRQELQAAREDQARARHALAVRKARAGDVGADSSSVADDISSTAVHPVSATQTPRPQDSSIPGPVVNIDGTPMLADSGVDIRGNPFGVTSSDLGGTHDAFGAGSFGSSHDSFGGGSSGGGFGGMGGI